MNIVWLPSFETGIVDIDDDHRELVEVAQKIEKTLARGDVSMCLTLFHEFMEQAARHFEKEEIFLKSVDFPRLESHRAAHLRLLEMGKEALKTVEADHGHEAARKCLEEIIFFLLEDVIKADAEFKSYAQKKGLI
ncbi:MAG: hemerythrin domain-containing protein [Rhodospirillaceae bacterium]|nr:hemerythrin domain-containing protein [Rhodospirillaceae bacterium]